MKTFLKNFSRFSVLVGIISMAGCASDSHDIIYSPTIIEGNGSYTPTPPNNWNWSKAKGRNETDRYGRPAYDARFATPLTPYR